MKHHEAVFELLLKALGGPEYGVVECLVTYHLNGCKFISYPVPTCTLRKFWRDRPTPDFNQETVSWSLKQMSRTATALHWIHNFATYVTQEIPDGNRHGEISPSTIFWFPEETQLLDMRNVGGVLRIADMSLRRIDKFLTNSEDVRHEHSITYGAPEVEIERHSTCASDMWSLAGSYLEFVTWLLLGTDENNNFALSRLEYGRYGMDTDEFFKIIKDANGEAKAIVRRGVIEWVNRLHEHEKCSASIHDVLDLVMGHLLRVDPKERIVSGKLKQHMAELVEKAENDLQYLLSPVPRLRRHEAASINES
ncbi:hypothetical protein BGZ57DRAFT_778194 [Hyaloscypha finlandica]|nr:hypothetical protein BGZ57DRAFT_778194 [Hyaloscypha finlandica]